MVAIPYFKTCSASLQHLFHSVCNFLSYLCNLHISSCKPQSTKLSWLICTHSVFLPFHKLSLFLQIVLRLFTLLSKSPWLSYSLQSCFYLFSPCSALPPSFINVPRFSYSCSSHTLAGSSFSKDSYESKKCKTQGLLVPFWYCGKCQIASNHSPTSLYAQEELCFALNYEYF